MDLFTYPDSPGFQNTDTSVAAAEAIKPQASTIRDYVLRCVTVRPQATFEMAKGAPYSYRAIQPRTSELRAQGKLADSGKRRVDPETGRTAIVWALGD